MLEDILNFIVLIMVGDVSLTFFGKLISLLSPMCKVESYDIQFIKIDSNYLDFFNLNRWIPDNRFNENVCIICASKCQCRCFEGTLWTSMNIVPRQKYSAKTTPDCDSTNTWLAGKCIFYFALSCLNQFCAGTNTHTNTHPYIHTHTTEMAVMHGIAVVYIL